MVKLLKMFQRILRLRRKKTERLTQLRDIAPLLGGTIIPPIAVIFIGRGLFQMSRNNFLDKVGYVRSQNADEKGECESGKINQSPGP
jgi:hypothetical protein